jgi:hypothetical protein
MRQLGIITLLTLCFSCDDKMLNLNNISPQLPLKKELPGNTNHQEFSKTINLNGYDLTTIKRGNQISIEAIPDLIELPLQIRFFQRIALISNIESLKDACIEMDYLNRKYQSTTTIRAKAHINPFGTMGMSSVLINLGILSTTQDLVGGFDAKSVDPKIYASFLDDVEKSHLIEWLKSNVLHENRVLAFDVVGRLDNEMPSEPIMELSRLICGILLKTAHLDFILQSENNKLLISRINRIEFVID